MCINNGGEYTSLIQKRLVPHKNSEMVHEAGHQQDSSYTTVQNILTNLIKLCSASHFLQI